MIKTVCPNLGRKQGRKEAKTFKGTETNTGGTCSVSTPQLPMAEACVHSSGLDVYPSPHCSPPRSPKVKAHSQLENERQGKLFMKVWPLLQHAWYPQKNPCHRCHQCLTFTMNQSHQELLLPSTWHKLIGLANTIFRWQLRRTPQCWLTRGLLLTCDCPPDSSENRFFYEPRGWQ